MGVNWSKKVVNKGLEMNGLCCRSQTEAIEKPTETGVALLSRYSLPNGKDGFEWISKR